LLEGLAAAGAFDEFADQVAHGDGVVAAGGTWFPPGSLGREAFDGDHGVVDLWPCDGFLPA
jgi:hypothetical protein